MRGNNLQTVLTSVVVVGVVDWLTKLPISDMAMALASLSLLLTLAATVAIALLWQIRRERKEPRPGVPRARVVRS